MTAPVAPKPAASVLLVRPGAGSPLEVYMIRRQKGMRFLGGYYAFPGGKVDAAEGFWIDPTEGFRRCRAGEMAMAEPAEDGLGYLAEFPHLEALWAAHADGRHKLHGIVDRLVGAGVRPRPPGGSPE